MNTVDSDIRIQIEELINNEAFMDEIENILMKIIKRSSYLSEEEQCDVKQKCYKKMETIRKK